MPIDALRGRAAARRLLHLHVRGDRQSTWAGNVEEIFPGILPGEREPAQRLFIGLRMVPLGRVEGERAGAWRPEVARRGRTLSQAGWLGAAAAVTARALVATGNRS